MERPIIEINEELCNGCGQCILDCAEGALAIVDGKARLVSDVYCDGLGACLSCPQGALSLKTREAPPFDKEAALLAKHAKAGHQGSQPKPLVPKSALAAAVKGHAGHDQSSLASSLRTWPIQLSLVPEKADWLAGADILLAAQCAGFALPDIQEDWLKGRIPVIACPKLQNHDELAKKLAAVLKNNDIAQITALRMQVPCCGIENLIRMALKISEKNVPWQISTIK